MTVPADRFWAKVLFKEFIRHYRKLDDQGIVDDVRQSMDDLEDLNDSGTSFGSKMVNWSNERKESPAGIASAENGRQGGRPPTKKIPPPRDKFEVYDFAREQNIWEDFAAEWFIRNYEERNGTIYKTGEPINNWKGALIADWKKNKDNYQRRMNNDTSNSAETDNQLQDPF